jgi:2-keto-4-pentenoate hydratase/2-oxohepta-3-ene-1,7-dioic acid hydratase in catechol pathway
MHFKIFDQLEYISKYITLEPGDIIMTGTPEGAGPVEEGDLLQASLSYHGKTVMTIQDTI